MDAIEDVNELRDEQLKLYALYKEKGIHHTMITQSFDKLSKGKQKFTDDLFPPNMGSIYVLKNENDVIKTKNEDIKKGGPEVPDSVKRIVWRRLSEELNIKEFTIANDRLIKNSPQLLFHDINQGDIGDCYFLCAISSVAEFPDLVSSFFNNMNIHPNGIFECNFYLHGIKTQIVIDDYFPFYEYTYKDKNIKPGPKALCYANFDPTQKNLWALILEKCWAKLNVSYRAISKGLVNDAFEVLFPGPIETYPNHIYTDKLWDIIEEADKNDYLICADIENDGDPFFHSYKALGLVYDHAYTIIGAKRLYDRERKPIARLLQLRNPWGKFEWKGEWSDYSDNWTPELIKAFDIKFGDDGIFHISIDDFIKFFTNTQICKQVPNFVYNYCNFPYDSSQIHNFVRYDIDELGKTFFMVNQKNQRLYSNLQDEHEKAYENKFCSLLLFKVEKEEEEETAKVETNTKGNKGKDSNRGKHDKKVLTGSEKYTFINSVCGRGNRLHIEHNVKEAGTFILAVSFPVANTEYLQASGDKLTQTRNNWFKKHVKEDLLVKDSQLTYTAGVYSIQKNIKVEQLKYNNTSTNILRYSLFKYAYESSYRKNFYEEDEKESWRTCYLPDNKGSIGMLVYNNNSNGYIYELMQFSNIKNINLISIIDQTKNTLISGLDNDSFLESEVEIAKEDYLQSRGELESRISMLNRIDKEKGLNDVNRLKVQLTVGPKSNAVILFEKYEETTAIDFTSEIVFSYPIKEVINNYLFVPKRSKIKYRGKNIDVIESIYEHNTGVIFKYKNKTHNYRVTVFINFSSLDNLEIKSALDIDEHNKIIENKQYNEDDRDFEDKNDLVDDEVTNPKTQALIDVGPGESKILELTSINKYKLFSYLSEFNYNICMCGSVYSKNDSNEGTPKMHHLDTDVFQTSPMKNK